jgi:imidazolonepropionase-like amidohydrolase
MKRFSLLFIALLVTAPVAAEQVWIQAGTVIDGVSETASGPSTVIVEAGLIIRIVDGFQEPDGEGVVIALHDATLMPGLIDLHTHLTYEFHERAYMEPFRLNEADFTLMAVPRALATLEAGFTTIRELGDRYNVTVALRDAIARGLVPGPRILTAAKSIASTGGHADPTNGWADIIAGSPGPDEGVADGVPAAMQAVRQRYKDGADLIKITATGGVLSVAANGLNPQFTQEEMDAIVQVANDYGMTVAAHAHGKEGMLRAVRAGVRTIEHGTMMDAEVMREMDRAGTYFVPTLSAGRWVTEMAAIDGFFPEIVRSKAAAIGPLMVDTFAAAVRRGVAIAFGTDTGVTPHGQNAQEFSYMVEGGMSPMDAIRSATSVAATVLEMQDEIGQVRAGFVADLVAVQGDPLADIDRLRSISFVMRGGEIVVR